jgi:hypothetical protein
METRESDAELQHPYNSFVHKNTREQLVRLSRAVDFFGRCG